MSIHSAIDEADRHDQTTPILDEIDIDEQHASALPVTPTAIPEADGADYLDQQRVVPMPDDDYPPAE